MMQVQDIERLILHVNSKLAKSFLFNRKDTDETPPVQNAAIESAIARCLIYVVPDDAIPSFEATRYANILPITPTHVTVSETHFQQLSISSKSHIFSDSSLVCAESFIVRVIFCDKVFLNDQKD